MIETQVHSRNIVTWAKDKPEVFVLSGDLTGSTEIAAFKSELPEQFYSLGMAEQNMLSWAGGMAREGLVPYLHTFAVFLVRRPYDQLAMSICYPNLPVKLVGFLPGIMTPGGVSHQAIEDISLMRGLPNMTVLEVGDAADIESVLDVAHAVNGPVYIRMLRGAIPRLFDEPMQLDRIRHVSEGEDITIFSSGICTEEVIRARRVLEEYGVSITHRHVTTHKPFKDPAIADSIRAAKKAVFTVENHTIIGGLGSEVAETMAEIGAGVPLMRIGIDDTFAHGASARYLMDEHGLTARRIVEKVADYLGIHVQIPDEIDDIDVTVDVGEEQLEAL
ncbi:transketolase family protein [Paramicrobacterium chengjingii]|uniref:transketolase family protein n=1 Tax=Paramicrobacterium chengjingii TaxID=2769067 RepID=UPI00142352F5|nr:transketolase C-terminal domain-containing protein [Microbacterium chengjingii]